MCTTDNELAEMVHNAYVNKRVYTDPEIFHLEMERIFKRSWVYVAHESQIGNPGNYITTTVGTQPLILLRDDEGQLRMFYNRCGHKGARLLVNDSGSIDKLVCHFHAYSFNKDGSLASLPLEDCYENSGFGRCNKDINLREVVCLSQYRGFIFTKLTSGGPDLETWLGDARVSLDNFVDRSPEGRVEVVGSPLRWINHCNWKMLTENIVDGTHVVGTHPSIAQAGVKLSREYLETGKKPPPILELAKGFHRPAQFLRDMGITVLENGHCYNGGRFSVHSDYSDIPGYFEVMKDAYGEGRAEDILSVQRHNTCIYPNMHMKNLIQKIRIFKPLAPDKTLTECWAFRLAGAPEKLLQRTLLYSQLLDSPATMVSTDDAEVMMRMQSGLAADSNPWISMHRGFKRPVEETTSGIHCEGDSELPFIKQYDTWQKLMMEATPE